MLRVLCVVLLGVVASGCRTLRPWVPPELGERTQGVPATRLYMLLSGDTHHFRLSGVDVDVNAPLGGLALYPPPDFTVTASAPGMPPLYGDCALALGRTTREWAGAMHTGEAPYMECTLEASPAMEPARVVGRLWVRTAPDGQRQGMVELGDTRLRLRSTRRMAVMGGKPSDVMSFPGAQDSTYEVYAGSSPVAAMTLEMLGPHLWLAPALDAQVGVPAALTAAALAVMVRRESFEETYASGSMTVSRPALPYAEPPPVTAEPAASPPVEPPGAGAKDEGSGALVQRASLRAALSAAPLPVSLQEVRTLLEQQPRWTDTAPLEPCEGCVEQLHCTEDSCRVWLRYGWQEAAFTLRSEGERAVRVEVMHGSDLSAARFSSKVWAALDAPGYADALERASRGQGFPGRWAPSLHLTAGIGARPGPDLMASGSSSFSFGVGALRWHTPWLLTGYGLDYLDDQLQVGQLPVRVRAFAPTVRVQLSPWNAFSDAMLGVPSMGLYVFGSPVLGWAHSERGPVPLGTEFLGGHFGARVGVGGSMVFGSMVPVTAELSYRYVPAPDALLHKHVTLLVGVGF